MAGSQVLSAFFIHTYVLHITAYIYFVFITDSYSRKRQEVGVYMDVNILFVVLTACYRNWAAGIRSSKLVTIIAPIWQIDN